MVAVAVRLTPEDGRCDVFCRLPRPTHPSCHGVGRWRGGYDLGPHLSLFARNLLIIDRPLGIVVPMNKLIASVLQVGIALAVLACLFLWQRKWVGAWVGPRGKVIDPNTAQPQAAGRLEPMAA